MKKNSIIGPFFVCLAGLTLACIGAQQHFTELESPALEEVMLSYLDNDDATGACAFFCMQVLQHPTLTPEKKYEVERIGDNLLILASLAGFSRVVRRLLQSGVSPDWCTYYGTTPLFYAVEANKPDIVKLLLDFGADPHCVTRYGEKLQDKLQDSSHKLIQVLFAMYTDYEIVK